ncbi:MAG: N-acetylglucosamine-6-phosphate deacetylase [Phycisphaeraceae bacterium]|nr:N-acetylglucosamine-6-phosphate deacetylase [Phycisphaeraceae bacterium]
MKTLLIKNCRHYDAPQDAPPTSVLIKNGQISHLDPPDAEAHADQVIQAEGRCLAPGFIDVHIQGAGGADVLDNTEQALSTLAKTCARFGVTSYLATTVYKPGQDNAHLPLCADCVGRDLGGAALLGIHLEGPFIAQVKRGMIQPDCLCMPRPETLGKINDLCQGHLTMMTIAPELSGALNLIEALQAQESIASLGHTNATYEQTLDGFSAGIHHVTHLFNAMRYLHHRDPGPLAAIFNHDSVTVQVIPDGVHIQPPVLKLALSHLGHDRVILITDGMQALGLPEGKYVYNDLDYVSSGGTARYHDGTLIGTAVGLSELVKRTLTLTGCSRRAAIDMVTKNPARLLGLDRKKGAIQVGMDADLVLLNEDLSVHTTCVAGNVVYSQ